MQNILPVYETVKSYPESEAIRAAASPETEAWRIAPPAFVYQPPVELEGNEAERRLRSPRYDLVEGISEINGAPYNVELLIRHAGRIAKFLGHLRGREPSAQVNILEYPVISPDDIS